MGTVCNNTLSDMDSSQKVIDTFIESSKTSVYISSTQIRILEQLVLEETSDDQDLDF